MALTVLDVVAQQSRLQTGLLMETAEASQSIDNPVAVRQARSLTGKRTDIPRSQPLPESTGTMNWICVPTQLGGGNAF